MKRTVVSAFLAFTVFGCADVDEAPEGATAYVIEDGSLFPTDRSLTHAEDGVALDDGQILVGDWDHGLVLLAPDGTKRPFGDFSAAGFQTKPAPEWNSPNGVSLEPGARNVLVADITSGHIYRAELATEKVAQIYDHPFGVNSVVRDPTGAIWFTQSTENAAGMDSEARMFAAADRPLSDGAVFRISPEQSSNAELQAKQMVANLDFANGIAFDEARGRLYVAELMANRVLSFDVDKASGELSNRRTLVDVTTPDNLELDDRGNLWIASPVANAVYVVDLDTTEISTFFEPTPIESSEMAMEWRRRIANDEGTLDLIGPEMFGPMPGLLTGIIISPDGGPVFISGLGDALIKIDRP